MYLHIQPSIFGTNDRLFYYALHTFFYLCMCHEYIQADAHRTNRMLSHYRILKHKMSVKQRYQTYLNEFYRRKVANRTRKKRKKNGTFVVVSVSGDVCKKTKEKILIFIQSIFACFHRRSEKN